MRSVIPNNLSRRLRFRAETFLVRLVRAGVPRVPWVVLYGVGEVSGLLLYWAARGRRHIAVRNLTLALGSRHTPAQREVLARRSCQHLVKTLLEFVRLPELSPDELCARVSLIGADHLAEALSHGKGAILVTPHLGNWEYMASRIARAGFPLIVIGRDAGNPTVAREVAALRASGGAGVLGKMQSLRRAVSTLRENSLVGILPDQHAGMVGVLMEFFGERTPMHPIAALLARRFGCPICPGSATRNENNELTLRLDPPLWAPQTDDRKADVMTCMGDLIDAMERQIRQHPDQYLWIHKRFRETDVLLEELQAQSDP